MLLMGGGNATTEDLRSFVTIVGIALVGFAFLPNQRFWVGAKGSQGTELPTRLGRPLAIAAGSRNHLVCLVQIVTETPGMVGCCIA
jgi:hypothetical protein